VWTNVIVDPADGRGTYTSLALDAGGNPRIAYHDAINGHPRFAERNGGVWTEVYVDPADGTGTYASLALDCNGNPRISYYDGIGDNLKFATRGTTSCSLQNPKEASLTGNMRASRGAGTSVSVNYTPACGAADHAIYVGKMPIVGAANWLSVSCGVGASGTASFDPGNTLPGECIYFVIVGQNGVEEGSYGRSTSGAERPEAMGIGACDVPQDLTGECM
jgi:hypothetical protein